MKFYFKDFLSMSSIYTLFFLLIITKTLMPQKPDAFNYPILTTDKDIIEYDTILQNTNTTKHITVSNKGNVPLQIYNIRSSCGVSTPSWPRSKISPGKHGVIQVNYNSSRLGPINRKLIIHSNSPKSTAIVEIKGFIIPW